MKRIVLVMLVAVMAAACKDAPSETECRSLLEHTASLEMRTSGGSPDDPQWAEQLNQLVSLTEDEFMRMCLEDISRERIACALDATDKSALRACDDK